MASPEFIELIPGLPEELALDCLTRLHYSAHGVASRVCKRWLGLLQSRDFYYHRKKSGQTHKAACLVQALPVPSDSKPVIPPSYGISIFEPEAGTWDRVGPIPKYPNGLPLFCQVASAEGKLFVMGGWDATSWDPVRDVFRYDFTTRRWAQCAEMPSGRSFFAAGATEGRIFIAGGHDGSKNALSSAWALDIARDEWVELSRMREERDECEGVMVGSEFWVVSGYGTESQGRFKSSAERLDPESGEWRAPEEEAWREGQCPRSCVAVGQNGQLTRWAECDPEVSVGACGVELGEIALVTGSAYQGGAQGFYLAEEEGGRGGQNGKLTKIDVPEEFCGFVQSGCLVEI